MININTETLGVTLKFLGSIQGKTSLKHWKKIHQLTNCSQSKQNKIKLSLIIEASVSKIPTNTVVADYININKAFDLNSNLYQAFKEHGYTKMWKQREAVNLKSFSLINYNL